MWLEMLAQADVVKDVATSALANGVFGTVSVGLAVALVWRERINSKALDAKDVLIAKAIADKDAVQAARLTDFQAQLPKLIDINTSVVTALTNAARTLDAQQEASDGLKDAVKDLAHEIRERKA